MRISERLAPLAIIIGVITVSFSAVLVKLSSGEPGVIAFYRMFFSALILLPFFLKSHIKEVKHLKKKDWMITAASGVFLACHFILWFESLQYTSVASSTVLVTMQPLFAFAGAYFLFKERITSQAVISALVAISGSVLIGLGDLQVSGLALFGDILALISCAFVTGYLLFGQSVRKHLSLTTYTFLVYSFSALVLLIYVLIKRESLGPFETNDWIIFLSLAILPTLFGHSLFNWAVKWVSTTVISMAILFEPVGAAIFAYFILHETISTTQSLGGMIILLSLGYFVLTIKRIKVS
ncbi:DMT family transporter [Jeotgalibacillus salarius]|uniref:DMT family transporter n=1 Tax=Jeotgalibacillus salarius TaxID=546023 RepID=A0A4Y8LQK3_9BACL|nr:DMT family transporter [Jeotgalibacillus salarius]TFE03749.1 DMT family transporter [Jeotgalibacillus salarius]